MPCMSKNGSEGEASISVGMPTSGVSGGVNIGDGDSTADGWAQRVRISLRMLIDA